MYKRGGSGQGRHSLAIVGQRHSQVGLVKHDMAKVLHSRELVGVGPELFRVCGFNSNKH